MIHGRINGGTVTAFCYWTVIRHPLLMRELMRTLFQAASTIQAGLNSQRSTRRVKPFEEMFATQQASKASETDSYYS